MKYLQKRSWRCSAEKDSTGIIYTYYYKNREVFSYRTLRWFDRKIPINELRNKNVIYDPSGNYLFWRCKKSNTIYLIGSINKEHYKLFKIGHEISTEI